MSWGILVSQDNLLKKNPIEKKSMGNVIPEVETHNAHYHVKDPQKLCSKETTLSLWSSVSQICFCHKNLFLKITFIVLFNHFLWENSGICVINYQLIKMRSFVNYLNKQMTVAAFEQLGHMDTWNPPIYCPSCFPKTIWLNR